MLTVNPQHLSVITYIAFKEDQPIDDVTFHVSLYMAVVNSCDVTYGQATLYCQQRLYINSITTSDVLIMPKVSDNHNYQPRILMYFALPFIAHPKRIFSLSCKLNC